MTDVSEICSQLDAELLDTIAQRRGSVLLKARRDGNVVAVKGYDLAEKDTYDRKELLDKEAEILEEVDSFLGNTLFVAYVATGESDKWLITKWIDGATASEFSRGLEDGDRTQRLASMFRSVAGVLRKVHHAGYLHGDIQPAHVIISPELTDPVLIDWGLGRRIIDTVPYSGGFVHYAAPEIAQGMIDERSDIAYTVSAEIYSFGAMMALCYSGNTAVDYELSEPLSAKLSKVAAGNLRKFGKAGSPDERKLLAAIEQCLSFEPDDRPASFDEVEELLS